MRARHTMAITTAVTIALTASIAFTQPSSDALSVLVSKTYGSYDNPLHTEFTLNGKTVNIFTGETVESLAGHLKPGWNSFVLKTTAQEPATDGNGLQFKIGPASKKGNQIVVGPVLWMLRNDADWKHSGATYTHPLGPGVKEVTLTYNLYYAGMDLEQSELKAGDYVLQGKATYGSYASPVVGTVWINGTPLNSFTPAPRQIVITKLLKPGRNEIRLVSGRVPNAIVTNDIEFLVGGPAEWNVSQNRFTLPTITTFKTLQGWQRDSKTGQLVNLANAQSETIERTIPFIMKSGGEPK
jgi:hypothetical protein